MNIHQLSVACFDEPTLDQNLAKGIPHLEMKNAMDEINACGEEINRLGLEDFRYVGCSLTSPINTLQRNIFRATDKSSGQERIELKLDRNLSYMVDLNFEFQGQPLPPANVRIPAIDPGGKFVLWGKTNFAKSVLMDKGVNVAKGGIYVPLNKTSFNMERTSYPFKVNGSLMQDNVIIGNPHKGKNNKPGKSPEKITRTQNIFLYLLAKYGWTGTMDKLGTKLELVEGESYEAVYQEYYPKGYMVLGASGVKEQCGLNIADWVVPNIYILYKGDIGLASEEYRKISMIAANFYYIADKTTRYLDISLMEDTTYWYNILGRFIFYREGKPGSWYTDEGERHMLNSMDKLLDARGARQLNQDGIECEDMYDIFRWVLVNEKEIYSTIHPSDISRKRLTSIQYLLRYILHPLTQLSYDLIDKIGADGKLTGIPTAIKASKLIRKNIGEGGIRTLSRKEHGECESLESPSGNMFITSTRAMIDQTRAKGGGKEFGHMYNPGNTLHPSKVTRARVAGVEKATPSGATQLNALLTEAQARGGNLEPWLLEVEDFLTECLNEDF